MDAFVDPYLLTLATTTLLRGLGAGMITGVELMTLPARRHMGVVRYAQFARVHYKGGGVRAYAGITVIGALLTIALSVLAFLVGKPFIQTSSIVVSLVATFFGFVGTAQAIPAMRQLWQSSDDDEILLASLLDRFARWGVFSATCHVVSFVALVVALVAPR
jgi:hypothetical protein